MEALVEKLTVQDLDSFWLVFSQLMKTGFPGYSKKVVDYFLNKVYSKESFLYWLKNDLRIVLVAKVGGKIVGFAVLDKPYGGVCFCRWLGVLQDFRKKGIGRKLMAAWLNYAKDYGCHKIELAAQPEAKGFYEKCGLELEGKRKLSYFGIDQYIFGKVIGEPKDEVMTKD